MPKYRCTTEVTLNSTPDTDDTAIELLAASGSAVNILGVEVHPREAANDDRFMIKLVRQSAAGATGTGGTITKFDRAKRNSSVSVNVKNGASAFTVGTITDTVGQYAVNGRAYWRREYKEGDMEVDAAQRFSVVLQCNAASKLARVTLEWED